MTTLPFKSICSPSRMRKPIAAGPAGTTLVELMVAVAILGVISIGFAGAFASIGKSVQYSKNRSLASNLAQEQIQILKKESFNRILVTTATAYLSNFNPQIPYDTSYYPPETILEGGMKMTRYTYIQVADENSGSLIYSAAIPDTGMKAVTITVVWSQGSDIKDVQVRNIIGDINMQMNNAVIQGKVTISPGAVGIQGALVNMAENVGFQDFTDAGGNYLVNLLPGSYTMNVRAKGYFSQYLTVSVPPVNPVTQNIALIAMASGTVQGSAWLNNNLVISQVVGSTRNAAGFCQEYVEMFNPTTSTWQVNGGVALKYAYHGSGTINTISMNYNVPSVGPGAYYLFSNTSPVTVDGVVKSADAVFQPANPGYPDLIRIAGADPCGSGSGDADTIGLWSLSGGFWLDALGWTKGGNSPAGGEGTPLTVAAGLVDQQQFVRRSSTAGVTVGLGRAYDSGSNNVDFITSVPIVYPPRNSSDVEPVVAGVPADGAFVTATDGLSSVESAALVGSPPYAQFQFTSVATGTWTVYVSSGHAFLDVSSVTVAASATTMITNNATVPTWPSNGMNSVILSSTATQGYISGTVTNVLGSAISPGITVSANGIFTTASTSNGRYFLPVPPGVYDVKANFLSPTNSSYVEQTVAGVSVALGEVSSNVNFSLSQGGQIRGFCTRDGVNALPGIVFNADDPNGVTKDSEVTGSDGKYLLINLSTGVYTVYPILDTGEISAPTITTVTVSVGVTVVATTFTVSGAFGTVTGKVTAAGQAVKTGTVIVCSTVTLPFGPPALNVSTPATTYVTNSLEDGTYSLDVRGSTTTSYVMYAYYPTFNGTIPVTSSRSVSGVSITAGQTTTGINFGF